MLAAGKRPSGIVYNYPESSDSGGEGAEVLSGVVRAIDPRSGTRRKGVGIRRALADRRLSRASLQVLPIPDPRSQFSVVSEAG